MLVYKNVDSALKLYLLKTCVPDASIKDMDK